jgi:hypothetical protein
MPIIALRLEVAGTGQPERGKSVEPQCLTIAFALNQDYLLRPVQAVQPVQDGAMALWLAVPQYAVVTVL